MHVTRPIAVDGSLESGKEVALIPLHIVVFSCTEGILQLRCRGHAIILMDQS